MVVAFEVNVQVLTLHEFSESHPSIHVAGEHYDHAYEVSLFGLRYIADNLWTGLSMCLFKVLNIISPWHRLSLSTSFLHVRFMLLSPLFCFVFAIVLVIWAIDLTRRVVYSIIQP